MRPRHSLLLFLSVAAGWWGWRAGEQPPVVMDRPHPAPRPQAATPSPKNKFPTAVTVAMERIRRAQGSAARQQATIDLARSLSTDELLAWLRSGWFTFQDGGELRLFTEIAWERLAAENPRALLRDFTGEEPDQTRHLITLCAARKPELAMDWFHTHPDDKSEMKVWRELAPDSPDAALKGLLDVAGRPGGWPSDTTNELLLILAEKRGPALREAIGKLAEAVREDASNALEATELQADLHGGIEKLAGQADGLEKFENLVSFSPALANSLPALMADLPEAWRGDLTLPSYLATDAACEQWAELDLQGMGYPPNIATEIREKALGLLVDQNPGKALEIMAREDHPPFQTDEQMWSALRGLDGGPESRSRWEQLFTAREERETIAEFEERMKGMRARYDVEKPEIKAQDWVKQVTAPSRPDNDEEEDDMRDTKYLLAKMTTRQLAEVQADFRALPDDSREKQLAAEAIHATLDYGQFSSELEGDAVRYLITRGGAKNAGSYYAMNLVTQDPAAAVAWVEGLPEGEDKQQARQNMAGCWRNYDPEAVEAWLKTLPHADQQAVRTRLDTPQD